MSDEYSEDANRELRAMMMSLLHLPPLPSIMTHIDREDNTVLSTDKVGSSHNLLASMIEWVATIDNAAINNERLLMQIALQERFHQELDSLNLDGPIEPIYNFYCHHTRQWIYAYVPDIDMVNKLIFKPLDSICAGDKIHGYMLSYAKAQYHYYKKGKEEADISEYASYGDILRKCAKWSREWNMEVKRNAASVEEVRETDE